MRERSARSRFPALGTRLPSGLFPSRPLTGCGAGRPQEPPCWNGGPGGAGDGRWDRRASPVAPGGFAAGARPAPPTLPRWCRLRARGRTAAPLERGGGGGGGEGRAGRGPTSGTHGAGRLGGSAALRRRGSVARRASPALRGEAAGRRRGRGGGRRRLSPAAPQQSGERAAGGLPPPGQQRRQARGTEAGLRPGSTGRRDEARARPAGRELRPQEGAGEQSWQRGEGPGRPRSLRRAGEVWERRDGAGREREKERETQSEHHRGGRRGPCTAQQNPSTAVLR